MKIISNTSNKDEIISSAIELTDSQADRIQQLENQQCILFVISGLLLSLIILGV